MDQNNPLQNNFNNTGFNNYSQSPTNVIPMDYSSYLFTTDDNVISESYAARNYEQQQSEQSEKFAFSFVNNEDSTLTAQSLYYAQAPQYSTSSLNTNSSQANNSEIFQFEIPGFKIFVVPTSSPFANLTNLDTMQNQFQQDYTYSTPSLYTSMVGPSQLNQEQSYVSSKFSVSGSSGGSSVNIHHQQ
jgi:hypothetical protein